MRSPRTSVSLALLLAAACGGESNSDATPGPRTWMLGAEPLMTVGGHDTRADYVLHDVVDGTRLSDGRIAIANGGTREVRFYDATGSHTGTAGGSGQGPGELGYIISMSPGRADSLIVMSVGPGITWFDGEGTYVRSERFVNVATPPNHPCRLGEGRSWQIRPDGTRVRLLVDNLSPGDCPTMPEGAWRHTGLLGLPAADGSRFDTLLLAPAGERVANRSRPFGHGLLLAYGPDRIYASDTNSGEILAIDYEGDTLAVLEIPFEPRLVPDEAKDEGPIQVEQPDGRIRVFPGMSHYPEEFPPIGRLLLDSEGYLWTMRYPSFTVPFVSTQLVYPSEVAVGPEGAQWRVLDPTGRIVADITTPPKFFILEVGEDYVLGVARDDLDVETVAVYSLTRG